MRNYDRINVFLFVDNIVSLANIVNFNVYIVYYVNVPF